MYNIQLSDFDHETLIEYDPDTNDPPPELATRVRDWLNTNCPTAKVVYDEGNPFGVTIQFENDRDAILFRTFWM